MVTRSCWSHEQPLFLELADPLPVLAMGYNDPLAHGGIVDWQGILTKGWEQLEWFEVCLAQGQVESLL